MPAYCGQTKLINHRRQDVSIDVRSHGSCLNHYYYRLFEFDRSYELPTWTFYNKCPCNELDAILRRHCVTLPIDLNNPAYRRFIATTRNFTHHVNRTKSGYKMLTISEVMSNTRPKLRKRYLRAYNNLFSGTKNIFDNIAKLETFIKWEKMDTVKVDERKPARLIQHRSYEYLYLLKATMLPLKHMLYECEEEFMGQSVASIFGSGLDSEGLADAICEHFNHYSDTVALCFDHSKWDGHYSLDLMNVIHPLWISLSNRSSLLRLLLRSQRYNRGQTQHGLRYRSVGTRASGEWSTSLENSVCNFLLLKTVFPNARVCVNGDDSIVFVRKADYENCNFTQITEQFRDLGQETKLDAVAFEIEQISFCQCKPVYINGRYRMVRDPIRTISRCSYTGLDVENCLDRYLAGLGLCELAANPGVPILQEFALKLIEQSNFASPTTAARQHNLDEFKPSQYCPVTHDNRANFEKAFGFSTAEQIELEKAFSTAKTDQLFKYIDRYKYFHIDNVDVAV